MVWDGSPTSPHAHPSSPPSRQIQQFSKKEIEDLLRKGAYAAIMEEDDEGSKFCEEDIDQILLRRTTTITIESEGKGSTFAKVSPRALPLPSKEAAAAGRTSPTSEVSVDVSHLGGVLEHLPTLHPTPGELRGFRKPHRHRFG